MTGKRRHLFKPDAVLGRDRTTHLLQAVKHSLVRLRLAHGRIGGHANCDVQVAVAQVTDHAQEALARQTGNPFLQPLGVSVELVERHCHIVPQPVGPGAFNRETVFADAPEILLLAHVLRDHRIGQHAAISKPFEARFELALRILEAAAGHLEKHQHVAAAGRCYLRQPAGLRDDVHIGPPHHLRPQQAACRPHRVKRRHRIRRAGKSGERRCSRLLQRLQLQHRPRHDAKPAFRPDQQVLDVEPLVDLAYPRHVRHHRAVGQHRLKPQHPVAHHPAAERLHAACIGRDHAADGGRSTRGKVDPRRAPHGLASLLHRVKRRARLNLDAPRDRVRHTHPVHARHVHHDLPRLAHPGLGKTGSSAVRDDRHPVRTAQLDDGLHLLRRGWLRHHSCPEVARIHTRVHRGNGFPAAHPAHLLQCLDETVRQRHCSPPCRCCLFARMMARNPHLHQPAYDL